MTTKNTATNKTTTTKAKATAAKAVAAPKKEKPVATPKKPVETPNSEYKNFMDREDRVHVGLSTDVFSKEMLTELNKRTNAIKDSIGKIDSSFETIAFNLHWINAKQAYIAKGADSIAKYAARMFGYEKTTCYALIAVVERFAKRDDKGNILEQFDERYKGYSSSKLSLMVGLTDEQIQTALKPTMSVREIKKYINSLKEKPLPALPDGNGETGADGDNAETENVIDSTMTEVYTNCLFTVKGFEDYNKQLDKIDESIHKLYKAYPDAVIRIEVETKSPLVGKWVKASYGN